NLIHPIITQGHIGDILPDKIVFDAQTTNGGSGGPLFNRQGKGIGVTYAELKKASPSRGILRQEYAPAFLAASLEGAGAAALSVLTEEDFFLGSLGDL